MEFATSADGHKIAYARAGNGPPLVLVHGSLNDHRIWNAVLPAFNERFMTYAMDRRGRGESGPPAEHTLEQQFDDVVAVMECAGGAVDLIGHSYGAHCALGAAAKRPDLVKHLVLYEPPTVGPDRRDIALAFEHGDPAEATEAFFRDSIGVPPNQLAAMKASPFWAYLVGFAPTMPSEGRALTSHAFEPARFAAVTMPALFLVGSETEERIGEVLRSLAPYMPQAERLRFEGHGHGATLTAPKDFANAVLSFLAR
jgi:pimeloyl-ACP methyl ester carboxylesterase